MVGSVLFLSCFFDFLTHLPDFLLCRLCKLCLFIFKSADMVKIYPDMLNSLFCPFLVALMHFNPTDKLVEDSRGKVGKVSVTVYQLYKLLRPSSRVFKSG